VSRSGEDETPRSLGESCVTVGTSSGASTVDRDSSRESLRHKTRRGCKQPRTLRPLPSQLPTTTVATFTDKELEYLKGQRLARLATADSNNAPHVVPVGFRLGRAVEARRQSTGAVVRAS
jgi:Pyridoxamine 5'-phosphate oxidase